jgi:hypothetical protein
MKNYILLSFCFAIFTLSSPAQKDSAGYHKLNFCFTWFELGTSIPFKEKKLHDLPYGMNTYLYGPKGGLAGGLFGIGLYYKNHWGISAILTFQDYSVPDAAFKNYISSQYPGYFLPYAVQGHTYTLDNINYRLSYRFHKGHFTYEPQFQLGINDCDDFDTHFVLKEEGSNNFIEYDIKKENVRKNLFSYRAAMVVRWRFSKPDWKWNVEPGFRIDFSVIPTNFNYTITSSPYNMPATIYEVNVKRMRPAMTITAVVSVFRK